MDEVMGYKPNPKRPPYSMTGLNARGIVRALHPSHFGHGVQINTEDNLPTETADAAKAHQRWLAVMAIVSDQRRRS